VVLAGAGRADGMAVLFHVGIAGRGARFVRCGMANDRLGRGVARSDRSGGGQSRSDEEDGEERCGKCACESHAGSLCRIGGIPMLPCDCGICTIILVCPGLLGGAFVTMPEADNARTGKSPAAVRTVALFLFLATAISSLTGSSLLFPQVAWHGLWQWNRPAYAFLIEAHLQTMAGVLLLALGMVTGIAGRGLLRGKRWAWWIAVVVFAANGLGDLLTLVVRRDVVKGGSGVLIASLFLFLLMRSGTRRWFARSH
jgi:hypothetical protein